MALKRDCGTERGTPSLLSGTGAARVHEMAERDDQADAAGSGGTTAGSSSSSSGSSSSTTTASAASSNRYICSK